MFSVKQNFMNEQKKIILEMILDAYINGLEHL